MTEISKMIERMLVDKEGEPFNAFALAKKLGVDRRIVSGYLQCLERHGFVVSNRFGFFYDKKRCVKM